MKETELGAAADYVKLPAEIKVKGMDYFLLKNGDGYRLVQRYCPHAGALVDCEDGELVCYMHGWTFDSSTGRCQNVPSTELKGFDVEARDGRLYAML